MESEGWVLCLEYLRDGRRKKPFRSFMYIFIPASLLHRPGRIYMRMDLHDDDDKNNPIAHSPLK